MSEIRCPVLLGVSRDQVQIKRRLQSCGLNAGHLKEIAGEWWHVCRDHFVSTSPLEIYDPAVYGEEPVRDPLRRRYVTFRPLDHDELGATVRARPSSRRR